MTAKVSKESGSSVQSAENLLHANDPLQLQAIGDESGTRHTVRVIGQMPGVSILVTTPVSAGRVVLAREGQIFVARSFSRGRAAAFNTRILRSCSHPFPYWHLSYPVEAQSVLVRKSQRVNVAVQGTIGVLGTQMTYPCSVGDLSVTGAMVEAPEYLGSAGRQVLLALTLPILGVGDRNLRLAGSIRSLGDVKDEARYRYGMEFGELDAGTRLVLRAFIYENLLSAID